jgi:hypothetical protein
MIVTDHSSLTGSLPHAATDSLPSGYTCVSGTHLFCAASQWVP